MEALKEKQECEECDKARGEVIPEHSECQARLSHCVPGALDEVLMVEVDDSARKIKFVSLLSFTTQIIPLMRVTMNHARNKYKQDSTSISAALSCPKKTFLMNFPSRNTSTKA